MIDLLKEWQTLVSVLMGALYVSRIFYALKNALVHHRHDVQGVAYLPEKIEL